MSPDDTSVTRRRALQLTGGLAATGVSGLSGCLGGDDAPGDTDGETTTASLPTITKGIAEGGTTGLLAQVLIDEGFDEENGFALETEAFVSPPQVQQQLVLNEDIPTGYMGEIVATRNWAQGNRIQLAGPYQNYHAYVLTRADSDISEPQDLVGRTINWASREADAWLKAAVMFDIGFDVHPDDLELNETAPPASVELLANGELDSILLHEPIVSRALLEHDFEIIMDPEVVWRQETGLPLTTVDLAWEQSWYDQNEALAVQLARAVRDAQLHIEANFDAVLETYADLVGLATDEQIENAQNRMPGTYDADWSDDITESGLEVVRYANDLGILDVEPTEDIFNIIDV